MSSPDRLKTLSRRDLLAGLGAAAALPVLSACTPDYQSIVDTRVAGTLTPQPEKAAQAQDQSTPSPKKVVVTHTKVAVAASPQTKEQKESLNQTTWSRQVLIPPLKNGSGWLPASFTTTNGAPQEKIFFTNPNGQIEAVDLTGKTLWQDENAEKKTLFRGAHGWNQIVYASQSGNRIYALDTNNGKVLWTLNFSDYPQLQGVEEYSLNTRSNTIELEVIKGHDKRSSRIYNITSFDWNTRKVVWSMAGESIWRFKDTTVVQTRSEDSQTIILKAINQDTGKGKWEFSYPSSITPEGKSKEIEAWGSYRGASLWAYKVDKIQRDKALVAYELNSEKVTEMWRRTLPEGFSGPLPPYIGRPSQDRLYLKVNNSIHVWDQERNHNVVQLHDSNNGKFGYFTEMANTVFWLDARTTPETLHGYNFPNRKKWETKKVNGRAIGEAKGLVIFMSIHNDIVLFSGVNPTTGEVQWSTSGKTDPLGAYSTAVSNDQITYLTKQGLAYCKIGESKPPDHFYRGVTADRFDIFSGWVLMEIGNRGERGILSAVQLP